MQFANIIIVGNVGGDVNSGFTTDGKQWANFRLAVGQKWTDASGQKQERTDWYNISCFGRLAENVNQYVTRGQEVAVFANRIEARAYTNAEGQQGASVNIIARSVQFGARPGGAQSPAQEPAGSMFEEDTLPF